MCGVKHVNFSTAKHLNFTSINNFSSINPDIVQGILKISVANVRRFYSLKTTSQSVDLLRPLRSYLDGIEIENPELAQWLCQAIPAQCPFARDINLFGRHLFTIPPLCKLNPLYEEVVALRWRALCYLAEECGEFNT
jgi:Mo-dependent nitrogenase C-terminus